MIKLDDNDRRLIHHITRNPTVQNNELAALLKMPISTLEKRMARLTRHHYLERVLRVAAWTSAGYPYHYWVDIKVNRRELRERNPDRRHQDLSKNLALRILRELPHQPEFGGKILVEDVIILLGSPADLSVSLRAADHHSVFDFVTNGLGGMTGVESTSTFHAVWSTSVGEESSRKG